MNAPDHSPGIDELVDLLYAGVACWHEFGYEVPPSPDCRVIPPLGQRSAAAITAGHEAVKTIDDLTRQLYRLREQLVGELREDSDIRAARIDEILAERTCRCGHGRREHQDDDGTPGYCSLCRVGTCNAFHLSGGRP